MTHPTWISRSVSVMVDSLPAMSWEVERQCRRVGVRALLIHAETEPVAAFYTRIDAGFERSPTDPFHVVLLIKDLRRAIRDTVVP